MRVLFDSQAFDIQRFGGVSRYFAELIDALRQHKLATPITPFLFTENSHLLKKRRATIWPTPTWLERRNGGYYAKRFNDLATKAALAFQFGNVFHMTFYNVALLKHVRCPLVVTIYDMIPELFPQYFPNPKLVHPHKEEMCQRADAIICISHHTKFDLIRLFGIDPGKISVTHLGISPGWNKRTQSIAGLPDRYILFVGQRGGYKNFSQLVNSVGRLMKTGGDFHLVCIGGGKLTPGEQALVHEVGLSAHVHQMSAMDQQLSYCYSKALAFVFPSLYEGFGLPVLESFSSSCPVILSNRGSFPEVAGNAALYFDPDQPESLDDAIRRLLGDETLRASLIDRGHKRAREFTWEKTAIQSLAVYRGLTKQ